MAAAVATSSSTSSSASATTVSPSMMVPSMESLSQPPSQSSSPSALATSFPQQGTLPLRTHSNSISSRTYPPLPATPTAQSSSSSSSSVLDPPPNVKFADFLRTWSDAHVARWLTDIKCARHAPTFKSNDIRSDVLLELDQVTLKEMGITSIGDRLRILNAVKALRARCNPKRDPLAILASNGLVTPDPSSPLSLALGPASPAVRSSSLSRRPEHGRPPPLQLNSNVHNYSSLPHLVRTSQQAPESARSPAVRPLPHPHPTVSIPSSLPLSSASNTPSSSHPSRSNHAGLPLASRSQPPSSSGNRPSGRLIQGAGAGRRTPTQDVPDYTFQPLPPAPGTAAAAAAATNGVSNSTAGPSGSLLTPVSALPSNWAPYGLPPDPRAGIKTPRSTSPLSNPPPRNASFSPGFAPSRSPNVNLAHHRNLSASSIQSGSNAQSKLGPRPSTSVAASTHPYALSAGGSAPPPHNPANGLSPIAESFIHGHSPSTAVAASPAGSYTVGRGPFPNRPNTPSAPSLVDLRRKLVKFQLAGEGHSATINVEDCSGGIEVLERALKKFGKLNARGSESVVDRVGTDDGGLSVDGWSVFLDWGRDDTPSFPLTEAQLLAVCHTKPDDPARERGLTLRRTSRARRNKAHIILGDTPPLSPIQVQANPDLDGDDDLLTPYGSKSKSKAKKRASTISVLSGLGVPFPEKVMEEDGAALKANNSKTSKVRSFFGARPPSELITNHLREYFPGADRKMLKRTSVLRAGGGRRDSTWSFHPSHASSRFSVSTVGSGVGGARASHRTSISSLVPPAVPDKLSHLATGTASPNLRPSQDADPPRVALSTDDGHSVIISSEADSERTAYSDRSSTHLLPPVDFSIESLSETLNNSLKSPRSRPLSIASKASKRLSYVTELRSKKDSSDVASLKTMDEITEQVESRRGSKNATDADTASMIEGWTKVESADEVTEQTPITPTDVPPEEDVDDEYDDDDDVGDDDDDDFEGEEEEEEEEEDEYGDEGIKWMKGALIGSGSFGKVYLGMDATNGLLMAVKQVELLGSMNDDRKRAMVDALEREIELLKDLEHEHIVQYLYSSSDEQHFNIFLEYVPGGSVAALLRNYGAFEETLVRNFVRQILEGLDYVHERGIIHRDIKGANVLVDNKGGIKISDFGISKKLEDNLMPGNRLHRPSLQGSVFWMAPEVVKQTAYTKKADIWSVGCLIVEMFTGEHPWAQLNQMQAIFKIGSFSAKPPIPSDISSDAQEFLELCFELDHEARPSAGELLKHAWLAKIKPAKGGKREVS